MVRPDGDQTLANKTYNNSRQMKGLTRQSTDWGSQHILLQTKFRAQMCEWRRAPLVTWLDKSMKEGNWQVCEKWAYLLVSLSAFTSYFDVGAWPREKERSDMLGQNSASLCCTVWYFSTKPLLSQGKVGLKFWGRTTVLYFFSGVATQPRFCV